jgi:phosphomannomutase
MSHASVIEQAKHWAENDCDEKTKNEILALIQQNNTVELAERFSQNLEFGTAGLRGVIGGGMNRMNRAVVRRTSLGLARYLLKTVPDAKTDGVVIGRDGRILSREFAYDTAQILAAQGIKVFFFDDVAPTPVTAYACTKLRAAAAVMVTASHNPPEYNGYKVYWGNGAQIIPPHDTLIAVEIENAGPAKHIELMELSVAKERGLFFSIPKELGQEYLKAISRLSPHKHAGDISIVYTAMHGVGGVWVMDALKQNGFTKVATVKDQHEPDGAFPTVKFPNPEERGAMDLALLTAQSTNADIVLANDPDADRLAVMAKDSTGKLKMFSGNEVGVMLGHYLLSQQETKNALVATTIVSSMQLSAIAKAFGAHYGETLTGFKWIANHALNTQKDGLNFIFGYEEALGYTVGEVVRDKDGVGAALVASHMAAWCRSRGKTLYQYLEEIQRAHGLFVAKQFNATLPGASGAAAIKSLMQAFRDSPIEKIGTYSVSALNDYQLKTRSENGRVTPLSLPASNVVSWELGTSGRVTARPSGTEPKIKFYFELKETLSPNESIEIGQQRANTKLNELETAFLAIAKSKGLK